MDREIGQIRHRSQNSPQEGNVAEDESEFARSSRDRRPDARTQCDRASRPHWPHAPPHLLEGKGVFMVTSSTLHHLDLFCQRASLDFLVQTLREDAERHAWQLDAWAVFSNHYHFVGRALEDARTLKPFLSSLHAKTASFINENDNMAGRRVWFNYWETKLTFVNSYLARLSYVHQNPVRHGLVPVASQYPWCSAGWFERTAELSYVKTVYSFKFDKVRVVDDFTPIVVG
jgi:putative transposase